MKINEVIKEGTTNEAVNWLGAAMAGIPGIGNAGASVGAAKAAKLGDLGGSHGRILGMLKKGMNQNQIIQDLESNGINRKDAQEAVKDAAYEFRTNVAYKASQAQQQAAAISNAPEETLADQFKLDPGGSGVVMHGSKKYVRDANGNWVFFGSKRTVSPAEERILDQVAPLQTKASTTAVRTQKPISITDHAGVVFDYDDASRTWYAGADAVTDPVSIQKLNKAAETQFQNRQMAHE